MTDSRSLRPTAAGDDAATAPPPPRPAPAAVVEPVTVGVDVARPGDPDGVVLVAGAEPAPVMWPPPVQPWSGWPSSWSPPPWDGGGGRLEDLTDVAWMCLDKNSMILAAMPPYLVGAASSLDAGWLANPDPLFYTCWEEFARQLFWDYQGCGEAIVVCTTRYDSGYPRRFHLLPPWSVDIEFDGPTRRYSIADLDITDDVLHLRYQSRTTDLHGRGPLEAGRSRIVAANLLMRYTDNLLGNGGVPTTVLTHPAELTATQANDLRAQWVTARMASVGLPAVLSGGTTFEQVALTPKDLTLTDLSAITETRIANLLGVPGYMVGLPQSSDSLVYNTAALTLDFHWRACLRNLVRQVMGALSGWALPTGTGLELNRDEYIKPALLERAQAYQILTGIGALTAEQVAEIERYSTAAPTPTLTAGVLQ